MKEERYDEVDDPKELIRLVYSWQKDALNLNQEVRDVRTELLEEGTKSLIANIRIEKLRELYHLRLDEFIEKALVVKKKEIRSS